MAAHERTEFQSPEGDSLFCYPHFPPKNVRMCPLADILALDSINSPLLRSFSPQVRLCEDLRACRKAGGCSQKALREPQSSHQADRSLTSPSPSCQGDPPTHLSEPNSPSSDPSVGPGGHSESILEAESALFCEHRGGYPHL